MEFIPNNIEFTVKVEDGNVFINGEFMSQLCWHNDAIGFVIVNWLDGIYNKED